MGCKRANHSRAIRGAAVPCGERIGISFWNEGFWWCTTAAHNQARRLAGLAGSFGNSRRPRLPGGSLSAPGLSTRNRCRTVHNVPIIRTLCTFLAVFVHNVPIFRTLCTLSCPFGFLFRPSAPLAVGGSGYQGRRRALAPLAEGKSCCRGRRRALAPLVARKSGCQGQRRDLAPLAGRKSSYQGHRGGSAPLVGGKTCCRGRRKAPVPLTSVDVFA